MSSFGERCRTANAAKPGNFFAVGPGLAQKLFQKLGPNLALGPGPLEVLRQDVVNPDREILASGSLAFDPIELLLPDDVLPGLVEEQQDRLLLDLSRTPDRPEMEILNDGGHRGEAGSGGDEDQSVDRCQPSRSEVSGVVAHRNLRT